MYQIFSPSSLFVSPLTLKAFNGRNRSVASKWHYFWLPPPLPLIQETEPSPAKLRKTESRHRSFGNTQTPPPHTHTYISKNYDPYFSNVFFWLQRPQELQGDQSVWRVYKLSLFAVCSGIPQSFHSTRYLCHRRFFEDLSAKYCTIFDEKPQKLGVFQNLPMKKLVVLVCSPSRARLMHFF